MRAIQKIGLILFVAALGAFVASLSMSEYRLTTNLLQEKVGDSQKAAQLEKQLGSIIDVSVDSKFTFIGALSDAFEDANKAIVSRYEITDGDIKLLQSKLNNAKTYELTAIEKAFSSDSESDSFKRKNLQDYTSWMNGNSYSSAEELKQKLSETAANINNGIIYQKAFDNNSISNLKFQLTKDASEGILVDNIGLWLILSFVLGMVGSLMYIVPQINDGPAGIKNNGIFFHAAMNRGWIGIITGTALILFYCFLYWFPEYLTNWVLLVDPISMSLSGNPASQWFLYGVLYCVAMIVMGIRMFVKYRNNKYQIVRTSSVLFFQLGFAFLIPELLERFNQPYFDFKNMWPLDYDFFFNWHLDQLIESGGLGIFMLVWGITLFTIGLPIMVYFFGKRWYCSWVCGCGGLAETLGDPFRHLSDKSISAWKVERWMIHAVLVFAILMTGLTLYTYFSKEWSLFGIETASVQKTYGFLIGSAFSGVVGTGFYPLMGNRMWCRFGCPLAAYLGLMQRFKSRFRITTNGGQCISCGNCSTYCEMGIDVRSYAQKGQNIVRSSCVGCGVCSAVCPRGVLKLENGPEAGRIKEEDQLLGNFDLNLVELSKKHHES